MGRIVNYSPEEKMAMRAAYRQLFGASKNKSKSPEAIQWMEEAAVKIVEYEGFLKGETAVQRNARMELMEVYDGKIDALSEHLKSYSLEYESMTKWAIVFTVYNGIKSSGIEAEQVTEDSNTSELEEDTAADSGMSNTSEMVQETVEAVPTMEEFVESVGETIAEDNYPEEPESVEVVDKEPTETVSEALGKATEEMNEPFTKNNNSNFMEEKEMSDALNRGAQQILGGQQNPNGANKPAPIQDTEAISAAKSKLESTAEARAAWSDQNRVGRVGIASVPASERFVSEADAKGMVASSDTNCEATVNKLYEGFKKVTGYEEVNAAEADLSIKFPNVLTATDRTKAEEILKMLLQLTQNPRMELPVFKPAKPTYNIKAYRINGTWFSSKELMRELIQNSTGGVNWEGDNEIGFSVAVSSKKVKVAEKGQSVNKVAATAQSEKVKIGVVRVSGKSKIIDSGDFDFIFGTDNAAEPKKVKAKAAIVSIDAQGNTLQQAAMFSYVEVDSQGRKKTKENTARGGKTSGKTKSDRQLYVMKTFTLPAYVEVYPLQETPNSDFGCVDAAAAKERYGASAGARGNAAPAKDWGSVEAMNSTTKKDNTVVEPQLVKLMAAMADGSLDMGSELKDLTGELKASAANIDQEITKAEADGLND